MESYNGHTHDEYEALLKGKLRPSTIRATLEMAGLYQIIHEMIKQNVLERVHDFFWNGMDENGHTYDEQQYRKRVRDRKSPDGKTLNKFDASVSWLVESGAITDQQSAKLGAIYAHRHELSHELIGFIIDVDRNPDIELFENAIEILKDINRFWTQIEIDVGSFEHMGDVDIDEVVPLSLLVLQQCFDAFVDGVSNQPEPETS